MAHLAAFVICSVSIAVLYAPALSFELTGFDDTSYALKHDWVRAGLTWHGVVMAFTTDGGIYWQPLTWLSHMLDASLFGADAGAYHLQNIAWHAGAALLLFSLARRFGLSAWWALGGALLWALHPLRVESVAWVASRKDVLSGFFFLLCLWLYADYAAAPRASRYLAMLAAGVSGYLAKPALVTLPFVLLLFDWWPLRRPWRWPLLFEKLPLFALSIAISCATYLSQQQAGALAAAGGVSLPERLKVAAIAYVWYLNKILWPADLALIYPYPRSIPAGQWIAAALILFTLTAAAVWKRREYPALFTGWLAFLGILVPMIGLVQAGPQPYADRFTYMATMPLSIAVVTGGFSLGRHMPARWRPVSKRLGASLVLSAVLMLAVRAHQQVLTWRNGETAFSHACSAVPENTVAATNLGALRLARGAYLAALDPIEMAVRVEPKSSVHQYNLGAVLTGLKRWREAEHALRRSAELDPSRAETWRLLGGAQRELGRRPEAIHSLTKAERAGLPAAEESRARNQLAVMMLAEGTREGVEDQFRRAIALDPENQSALLNLAVFLSGQNRVAEALPLAREALERFPENAQARGLAASLEARAAKTAKTPPK